MIGIVLAAVVAAASPSPAPSPASAPLTEIGRVRAISPFCLTLKQKVAPALLDVVANDNLLIGSQRVFIKRASILAIGAPGWIGCRR